MPRPHFCRNASCRCAHDPPPRWFFHDGFYRTIAHGKVQRYRCKACGKHMSAQSESMHYFAKRRLDLSEVFSRLRSGSSLRDIGRELGCSRTAVANAVVRLGRQSMASHVALLCGVELSGSFVFDGLVTAVTSRDYPSQIHTLVDSRSELLLAMTHAVTERGGSRSVSQRRRIEAKRLSWRPKPGALRESIALLVHELPRFAAHRPISIDTDEHPLYPVVLEADAGMRWYRNGGHVEHRTTAGSQLRTVDNRLFPVNYIDRMIRHRVKEHTRQSIAVGRNAVMQMHRMWIFAWDHNVRQPHRVRDPASRCRAEQIGVPANAVKHLNRQFMSRRRTMGGLCVPESIRRVWMGQLASPPVRWKAGQSRSGPPIRDYAKLDLSLGIPAG